MPKASAYKSLGRKLGGYKSQEYKAVGIEYAKEHVDFMSKRMETGIQGALTAIGEISRIYESHQQKKIYQERKKLIDEQILEEQGYNNKEVNKNTKLEDQLEEDQKEVVEIEEEVTGWSDFLSSTAIEEDEDDAGLVSALNEEENRKISQGVTDKWNENRETFGGSKVSPDSILKGGSPAQKAPPPLVSEGGYYNPQPNPGGAAGRVGDVTPESWAESQKGKDYFLSPTHDQGEYDDIMSSFGKRDITGQSVDPMQAYEDLLAGKNKNRSVTFGKNLSMLQQTGRKII